MGMGRKVTATYPLHLYVNYRRAVADRRYSPLSARREASALKPATAAWARLFISCNDSLSRGTCSPSNRLGPSDSDTDILTDVVGVGRSAGDEDGSSIGLSSAEDAVDGRRAVLFCGFKGSERRGAGATMMCGAVAVSENEMSFSTTDGTDWDGGTSPDTVRAELSGRLARCRVSRLPRGVYSIKPGME